MQNSAGLKIVIIGCGNVAWHLANHLKDIKHYNLFVYNHKPNSKLTDFKNKLNFKAESSFNNIIADADFYFICVSDKFISDTAEKLKLINQNAIVVHTSGSMKIEAIEGFKNRAVFYPLQSFSKSDTIKWSEIPVIIETENLYTKRKISNFSKLFSKHVKHLNYEDRLKLHLAAVFVNNFTNALFVAASDIVSSNSSNAKFDLLLPLIKQTVLKIENMPALNAQTGPAKRGDNKVLKKHLRLLSGKTDLKKIYKQLSDLIVKQQTNKHA